MSDDGTSLLGAAVLGALQGITEFLPVSSSGHLVLFQQWIEVSGNELVFDLILHVATLLPAIWFYRRDILTVIRDLFSGDSPFFGREGVQLAQFVVLASIPTAVIGLALEDVFESLFSNLFAVGCAFALTGVLLFSTRKLAEGTRELKDLSVWTALALGLAQGLAITPGISRSGTTIALALHMGIRREIAVKLSFLMSIPAITGGLLIKALKVDSAAFDGGQVAVGFVAAAVTGYLALAWLVKLVKQGRFASFSWYVWGASALAFGLYLL